MAIMDEMDLVDRMDDEWSRCYSVWQNAAHFCYLIDCKQTRSAHAALSHRRGRRCHTILLLVAAVLGPGEAA